MLPGWKDLLGPHPHGLQAVVKAHNNVSVDDVLVEIEAGGVDLLPVPCGISLAEAKACVGYAREHAPRLWRGNAPGSGNRLRIGRRALKEAFSYHKDAAQIEKLREGKKIRYDGSRVLLAVYAIECGLKNVLLKMRNVNHTGDLDESELTHDLNHLSETATRRKFFPPHLELEGQPNVPIVRLHEALRYGQRLQPRTYEAVVRGAAEAISHIEENL
ncbi:MAG: hypothetical protein IPK82_18815 [Polyangiaceae bacterium]|nr:hypothetical protein [Polyangiaceae bacterium]